MVWHDSIRLREKEDAFKLIPKWMLKRRHNIDQNKKGSCSPEKSQLSSYRLPSLPVPRMRASCKWRRLGEGGTGWSTRWNDTAGRRTRHTEGGRDVGTSFPVAKLGLLLGASLPNKPTIEGGEGREGRSRIVRKLSDAVGDCARSALLRQEWVNGGREEAPLRHRRERDVPSQSLQHGTVTAKRVRRA